MLSNPSSQKFRHTFGQVVPAYLWCLLGLTAFQCNAMGHGGLHQKMADLNAEIAKHPEDAQLHIQIAEVHVQHGDWAKTLVHLETADRFGKGRVLTDLLRGEALMAGNRVSEAKMALDRYLNQQPDHPKALLLRGRALKKMGREDDALADFRAVFLQTANPEPDVVMEVAKNLQEFGHAQEAMQVIAEGVKKLGAIPSLVQCALELEVSDGKIDAALDRVAAMQKTSPRPEPWMAKRASILQQAGRAEESRTAWQTLINHLVALPQRERGSHAMLRLAEEARRELRAFEAAPAKLSRR